MVAIIRLQTTHSGQCLRAAAGGHRLEPDFSLAAGSLSRVDSDPVFSFADGATVGGAEYTVGNLTIFGTHVGAETLTAADMVYGSDALGWLRGRQ